MKGRWAATYSLPSFRGLITRNRADEIDDEMISVEFDKLAEQVRSNVKASAAGLGSGRRNHDHPDRQLAISSPTEVLIQQLVMLGIARFPG